MYTEDSEAVSFGRRARAVYIPALVAAGISVGLMRSGFLSFLFLVPLGFSAVASGPATAWLAFLSAALINGVLAIGTSLHYGTGGGGLVADLLYYTVMALGFTWIMAGGFFPRVRTMYRFSIAAIAGALAFLCIVSLTKNSEGFTGFLRAQAEWLSSVYISASGADAARRSALEHLLTPEKIMETVTAIALRGGGLVSAFFLLFVNRQVALGLVRIVRRRTEGRSLSAFHVPANTIWVLSISLAAVLLTSIVKAAIPEIIAWNIVVLCAILFLAQGAGIAFYALTRRPLPPFMRLLCTILIVVMLFSPGINMAALGLLLLLGIAENWLPLRAPKQDGPASTPGL
jgi:hypothetical protein